MSLLEDGYARRFHYLRLSLTEVCNFRCTYCLPDGYHPQGRPGFLTQPELERIVRAFAAMGTRKVRLTGGEPSLRRDLVEIINLVATTPGISRVAMTTNGYRLRERASQWRQAGLGAINVSLDSLDPRLFHRITGEDRFAEVMGGIEAALCAGFEQVKINTVLLKGLNDQELNTFLSWIRTIPVELRFIELMQTPSMGDRFVHHHMGGKGIRDRLLQAGWQLQARACDAGPAQVLAHPDYQGTIGLILPYAPHFCAGCNRLRVSAQGKLHLCLFGDEGIALRDLLIDDSQQTDLIERVRAALGHKPAGHHLHQGDSGATPHLASLGG